MLNKSLTELVVIVAGVVIGLAADRWIKTIDDRTDESKYYANLITNLRLDSVRLEERVDWADSVAAQAFDLLLFVQDGRLPIGVDTSRFIRRVSTLSYYGPMDFARETWDDLVSSGKIQTISHDSLSQTLSSYYNEIERLAAVEQDWEAQLRVLEVASWQTQEPLARLWFLGDSAIGQDGRASYPATTVLREIRTNFRSDRALWAALGQARLIRVTSKKLYARELANVSKVLAAVRAHQR